MTDIYAGPADAHSATSRFNSTAFLVSQMLGELWTVTIAKVIGVHGGGLGPVGTVDVQPLVAMIDGRDQTTPHGTISGLPYMRLQGGSWAVILDPQVGDIGITVHASRDISSAVATKAPAPPGSHRRFDPSDGLFIPAILGETPTQYIQFAAGQVTVTAPTISLNGNVVCSGSIVATGNVTGGGKSLDTHLHTGVTTGSGTSGPPA